MHKAVVSGGPVVSRVLLVGQAPGVKEPVLGRPFAWTAGRTLYGWFTAACGWSEADFRALIYMAAVCRCFPGKNPKGGDRVPSEEEIANCAPWLERELAICRPELIIPVGKLAIARFLADAPLVETPDRHLPPAEYLDSPHHYVGTHRPRPAADPARPAGPAQGPGEGDIGAPSSH